MSKLPLKIQIGLRDSWNKDDAPVQKARSKLKELVGVEVEIETEWHLLAADLDTYYPDKSTFVPSVAACVQAWYDSLSAIVEDEANSKWADILVEKINRRLRTTLEVSKNDELAFLWSVERTSFIIALPRGPMPSSMQMEALFRGALLSSFTDKTISSTSVAHVSVHADDWADVSIDNTTGNPAVVDPVQTRPSKIASLEFDTLPNVGIISRPDDLLLSPPYHLVVYSRGKSSVEVQCSHSPTLQFLSEYLRRWCRGNNRDTQRPSEVEINLHQSAFGLGLVYDRLTMLAEGRYSKVSVSPMIVLSLVEGVLGYGSVSTDGSSWTFRRDVGLKKSS